MAKPTPKQLAERRRRKEAIKTTRDYIERFGTFACELTPATVSLMASSLKSGVDECASLRRATEERIKRLDEEHAAFLLQPIKAETEREYTALIKQRQLYEGACNLSWPMYFQFREEHADDVVPLSADDIAYAGSWTSCAVKAKSTP